MKSSKQAIQKSVRVANQKSAANYVDDVDGRVSNRGLKRDVARVRLDAVGGDVSAVRSPKADKAMQSVKDALHGDEQALRSIKSGGSHMKSPAASAKLSDSRWSRVEAAIGKSVSSNLRTQARFDRLARAVGRGLLSPAGLSEEVVGRTMMNVERKKFERAAKAQDKSPVKGTKRRA